MEGGQKQFAGVIYPSVAMWANGDNVALRPWFVDSHLKWTKAIQLRVDSTDRKSFAITDLDTASTLDSSGALRWLGKSGIDLPSSFRTGKVVFSSGRDELGDYIYSKNNVVGHWICVNSETGEQFAV